MAVQMKIISIKSIKINRKIINIYNTITNTNFIHNQPIDKISKNIIINKVIKKKQKYSKTV